MKENSKKNLIDWKDPKQITSLKILVRSFYDYQRERIALDGRIGRTKAGELKKRAPERDVALLMELYKRREDVAEMENGLFKEIVDFVHTHPLWKAFLAHVKGCGETLAAVMLSEIDIYEADCVSKLWSFAGLAPGKDKMRKGMKQRNGKKGCSFNQFLRAKLCGVLGSEFLQCKSQPYSAHYYNEKLRLENSENMVPEIKKKGAEPEMVMWKDATKDHRHHAAIRKMIKEFLKDLYVAWRTLEGLPVRPPYSEEYLGRKHGERKAA